MTFAALIRLIAVASLGCCQRQRQRKRPRRQTILVSRQLAESEGLRLAPSFVSPPTRPALGRREFRIAGIYEPTPDPARLGRSRARFDCTCRTCSR